MGVMLRDARTCCELPHDAAVDLSEAIFFDVVDGYEG
jgi:hypothetical protein